MTLIQPNSELPPVLIMGSGRSGTTLLMQLFASHPQVFAPKIETRFIVDPGGLIDLVDSMTTRYSPTRAREALYRFERLMRVDLVSPRSSPYPGMKLDYWFANNYWQALDNYCGALVQYEFPGFDSPVPGFDSLLVRTARFIDGIWQRARGKILPRPGDWRRVVIKEPRFYSNRRELIGLTRSFLLELFGASTRASQRLLWCEKTPHHLLHIDFLLELFPEARIVHMIRDPRDVVNSYTRQLWAPTRPADAARMLEFIYRAWFERQASMSLSPENYLEVRLEELALSPVQTLENIQKFCGLTIKFEHTQITPDRAAGTWRSAFDEEEIGQIEEILGQYIDRLGYR